MNPSTSTSPTTVREVEIVDQRRIFDLQRAHRWTMATTTAAQRIERLRRLDRAIDDHKAALAGAVAKDFGKPAIEFEMAEILVVQLEIAHTIKHLRSWLKPRKVRTPPWLFGARSEIRYEARGHALILAPWNYPFQLLIGPLIPAIAAGNVVMLRPSEKVPHTAAALAELIRATFPENEVALVGGGVEAADALLDLPFDHVFFTGSTAVGKKIARKAAEHLATVTLELGGKSPVIIDETADLEAAAERVVWGKFLNAGQTCVAPDYVLVHRAVEAEFLAAAKEQVRRAHGATEADRQASTDLARIIDGGAFQRLSRLLAGALEAGASLEIGGGMDAAERALAPTIVSSVAPDSPLMSEELFGPILPVVRYDSVDEAVSIVRSHGEPLALYVFSRDRARVEDLLGRTTAGGTVVNGVVQHLASSELPFGGVGSSGQGSYHGEHGIRAFSHERAVMWQGRFSAAKLFYPPYTARTERVLRLVNRLFR